MANADLSEEALRDEFLKPTKEGKERKWGPVESGEGVNGPMPSLRRAKEESRPATTAEALVAALSAKGLTCAAAESCTGGGIGQAITSVSGASAVFLGGVVSYANSVKREVLGVERTVLDGVGPVSEECARQMARGARTLLKADLAVSVTGLAGPGGDGVRPAGYVWFGLATAAGERTENRIFAGDRAAVRAAAVEHALSMLLAAAQLAPPECSR